MKIPPFLLGVSLLFWGWQTDLMPLAVIAALLLEAPLLVRFRINLSPVDFRRISDFNTLIVVALLGFIFLSRQSSRFIFTFLQWIPLALLPIILAQLYSTAGKIDPGAIFWSMRKPAGDGIPVMQGMDMRYPYLLVVILASGAANMRTPWFYAAILLLFAWSLWPVRSRRFSPALWLALLAFAALAGYGGHVGLNRFQVFMSENVPHWFYGSRDRGDTYRSMTAIGELGRLKLSNRILFRVEPARGQAPPALLRRASFNFYAGSTWVATQTAFTPVSPEADGRWQLGPGTGTGEVTIMESLDNGRGVLKLPTGCYGVKDLQGGDIDKNIYGAVRINEGPGLVRYRALYGEKSVLDSPPAASDLFVSPREKELIARIAGELGVVDDAPSAAVKKIEDFFRDKFRYSLALRGGGEKGALEEFLTRSHAGHCEFFATATVLLLRQAGVPARYATGYSVQDFSRMEKLYVVRARHAHSWALAFIDGTWRDVDNTPAGWNELEKEDESWWTPAADIWSWLALNVSKWRWLERESLDTDPLMWALLVAAALLSAWFLRRKSLTFLGERSAAAKALDARPGLDSEFYEIEKVLSEAGHVRPPWEPVSAWVARIGGDMKVEARIVDLHYRLRFDPEGLDGPDRQALKDAVSSWISQAKDSGRREKTGSPG